MVSPSNPIVTGIVNAIKNKIPSKTSDLANDGDGTNVFVKNNDTRLSDARTPTSHTHGNLQNDGKIGTSNNASKNVVTDANGKITTEAKPTIPTKTSQLTNDSGFLTSHQDISGKVNVSQGTTNSGKFLKVNSSGNVACESVTIPSAYTHPSTKQCSYSYTHPSTQQCTHNHSGTYAPISHTQASSTITDMSTVQVVVTYTDGSTETLTLFKQTNS